MQSALVVWNNAGRANEPNTRFLFFDHQQISAHGTANRERMFMHPRLMVGAACTVFTVFIGSELSQNVREQPAAIKSGQVFLGLCGDVVRD